MSNIKTQIIKSEFLDEYYSDDEQVNSAVRTLYALHGVRGLYVASEEYLELNPDGLDSDQRLELRDAVVYILEGGDV